MTRILSIDPSGTSISGLFYFENWNKWEISSIEAENWLEQAEKLGKEVKNKQVNILACETSRMWKKTSYTFHFDKLIKLVGHCEYLSQQLGIEYVPISNQYLNKWEAEAKEGKIAGLELRKVQGKNGRPKNTWYFKNKELNEHEKDAVLIFFIYWVKMIKKDWPWS
jgi:hypothetical protein